MYQFQDYFDLDKDQQPYTVPGEELEDYLRLLDMMLEGYLEFKGMKSSGKLFSRGLVVTESEMTGYFEMPPYFRERDIWDPVLAAGADSAFDYIQSRTSATRKNDPDKMDAELIRIDHIRKTFDLSPDELIAVLLALAVVIDRRYERIYGFLQDDISRTLPTTGLLYALTARITSRKGAEETIPVPLDDRMYTYFFSRDEGSENLNSPLILQPLMKKILMGISVPAETVSPLFRSYEEKEDIPLFFEESYRDIDFVLSNESRGTLTDGGSAVYLGSEDEDTVLHLLYRYCFGHGEKLYILDSDILNMPREKRVRLLSELYLRIKLFSGRLAVRYIAGKETSDADTHEADIRSLLADICRQLGSRYVFIFGEKEEPGLLSALYIPYLKIPDAPVLLRTEIWKHFLKEGNGIEIAADVNIPDLADCYEIPYGKVRRVIGHAIATARIREKSVIDREMILESLRQMNQVDFSGLASFVNPAYTWEDITITESQKAIMKTACDRYRLRNRVGEGWGLKRKNAYGNGVSILLYGPPGTGKTMAAQVIANELALPLYRVDISQISSKYIGETEKNLAVIFNAAAKANVILFFDEADALFSKRTSVGDSHDKYANSETAFLLQKIEEYDGMSILSTNYYNNFDDAFVRRITYSVHLQQPDKETRYTLWTTILPAKAEIGEDVDFRFLADKFELSGSNIKAILFNAAYMAGAENLPVGMKHIVRSLEYEFDKLGKLVNSSDFGKYDVYLQGAKEKKEVSEKKENTWPALKNSRK